MKNRWAIGSLLMLISVSLLTACWDAVPIESRNITTALAVDQAPDGSERLYTSLMLSNEKTDGNAYFNEARGRTPGDSREERRRESANINVYGQTRVIVFSEDVARQGIGQELDTLLRFPQLPYSIHMAVCQGQARDYLSASTNEHYDMGTHLEEALHTAPQTIPMVDVILHDFLYHVVNTNERAVLPYLSLKDGKPYLQGVALFKSDRLICVFGEEDASLLTMLRASNVSGSDTFAYQTPKGKFTASVFGTSDRRVQANYRNGKWAFDITIKIKGRIVDKALSDGLDSSEQTLSTLTAAYHDSILVRLGEMVNRLQTEVRVDGLDLAHYAEAQRRKELEGNDWDVEFQRAEIRLNVNVTIADLGEGT